MTIQSCLAEFRPDDVPRRFGPWRGYDDFDPPWKLRELDQMSKAGIIEDDREHRRFRLTLKATDQTDVEADE